MSVYDSFFTSIILTETPLITETKHIPKNTSVLLISQNKEIEHIYERYSYL